MSDSKPSAGAVVCEQVRASRIGTEILRQGGNAVDAIIATVLAVNTLAPYHSDIGGGGFAIIRTPSGTYEALDFRHTAPNDVTMDFYRTGASTSVGGSAVAVPGQMRGLEVLHQRYGKLSWEKLFEPSIQLAVKGADVCEDLRHFIKKDCVPSGADQLAGSFYESDPMFYSLFKDGKALAIGDTYTRPEFAKTLKIIAQKGADAFYVGEVAEAIVKSVKEQGGLMTLKDLQDYRPRWRQPLRGKYRGNILWTVPAPASGCIWLMAMGILDHLDVSEYQSAIDYHRVTEALRLAYGQRNELGDPDFVADMTTREGLWISEEYTAERAKRISDGHTWPVEHYLPVVAELPQDAGTSNITAADETGLVVSITTTIGLNWGSHIMVPGYGFILNDSMDDFSVKGRSNGTGYQPSTANYVVGGKRPLSSSCPYIVENAQGDVILAGGSAGGSTIISANTQVARNVLEHGLSAAEALRAARLHNQLIPNVSQLEQDSTHQGATVDGFTEELAEALRLEGHHVEWVKANRSTPCVMKIHPGPQWEPAGDPRKHDSGGSIFHP